MGGTFERTRHPQMAMCESCQSVTSWMCCAVPPLRMRPSELLCPVLFWKLDGGIEMPGKTYLQSSGNQAAIKRQSEAIKRQSIGRRDRDAGGDAQRLVRAGDGVALHEAAAAHDREAAVLVAEGEVLRLVLDAEDDILDRRHRAAQPRARRGLVDDLCIRAIHMRMHMCIHAWGACSTRACR